MLLQGTSDNQVLRIRKSEPAYVHPTLGVFGAGSVCFGLSFLFVFVCVGAGGGEALFVFAWMPFWVVCLRPLTSLCEDRAGREALLNHTFLSLFPGPHAVPPGVA